MQQLSHHRDDRLQGFLPSLRELVIEGFDPGLVSDRHQGRHIQGVSEVLIAGFGDASGGVGGSGLFRFGVQSCVCDPLGRFHIFGQECHLGQDSQGTFLGDAGDGTEALIGTPEGLVLLNQLQGLGFQVLDAAFQVANMHRHIAGDEAGAVDVVALGMVAAIKKYRLIITMPEGVSDERTRLLKAYGAEVVLTPAEDGMRGAIEKAWTLKNKKCFIPMQFENPANPEIHRQTTAREIIAQLKGVPDAFVAGVGTGGTITGIGETFKQARPDVLIVGVEPADSAVLSGGEPGPTEIDGLGAGMIPDVLNAEILDRVIAVSNSDARKMSRRLAREEGLLVGISSGAAVHATVAVASEMTPRQTVATVLCDTGERYLGTFLFG